MFKAQRLLLKFVVHFYKFYKLGLLPSVQAYKHQSATFTFRLLFVSAVRLVALVIDLGFFVEAESCGFFSILQLMQRPLTTGTFCTKQFVQEHELTNRLHAYMQRLKMYTIPSTIPADLHASQIWATPFLQQGKECTKWLLMVLKRISMVKDTTPSRYIMRDCGLEPLQFSWFPVAVRLCNALTQSYGSNARKILQADMQLNSRRDDCWAFHIQSAMNDVTQSYMFKERLLKCEPIDHGCFVVHLRERQFLGTLF